MTNEPDLVQFRARQKARSRVLGLILAALAVLFFAITIVKISNQTKHQHVKLLPVKQS